MSNESVIVLGVGASEGVGGALVRRFAQGGYHVFAAGRSPEKIDVVAEAVNAAGGSCETIRVDVTQDADLEAVFAAATARGPVAAVIFNAGNNLPIPFEKLDAETVETFWRIGCFGAYLTAARAIPILKQQGAGSLFFTGASASLRGKPSFAHFAMMKGGLRMLAQSLAREFGADGVHVAHVILDGVVNGNVVQNKYPEHLANLGDEGSLTPDAVAEGFWFLHSQPRSTWTHELDLRPFKERW